MAYFYFKYHQSDRNSLLSRIKALSKSHQSRGCSTPQKDSKSQIILKGFLKIYFETFSSAKSLKCNRRAVTDILISQKEIPKEISRHNKLAPNR